MAKTEEMELTEKMPFIPTIMERKSSPVLPEHPVSQDLLDLPEKREILEPLAHLVKMANLVLMELRDTMALPVLKDPQAHLVQTDQMAPMEKMDHQEKRERMATMELLVLLVPLDFLAKMATPEDLDLKDQRVILARQASPLHPTLLDLLVHLATLVKMVNQGTALLDLLAQLGLKDLKDFLANLALTVILEDLDRRETLELLVILEPQEKTVIPVPLAKSLVHLALLDLLAPLATMAVLARMVSLVALDIQAKMESPDLQDTRVKDDFHKLDKKYVCISTGIETR
jgi:hypothetical protein